MKIGDRVRACIIDREIVKNKPVYSLIYREGKIEKDYLLCVGNNELYGLRMDDGTWENLWDKQLEVIEG